MQLYPKCRSKLPILVYENVKLKRIQKEQKIQQLEHKQLKISKLQVRLQLQRKFRLQRQPRQQLQLQRVRSWSIVSRRHGRPARGVHRRHRRLGPEVEQLSALKSIDLSNNSLTILPPVLASLKCLETLNLSNNCINNLHLSSGMSSYAETKLKDGINEELDLIAMPAHEELDLTTLPALEELDLTSLPALDELDLSGNLLTEFPHSLTQTVSITRLNISNNELK